MFMSYILACGEQKPGWQQVTPFKNLFLVLGKQVGGGKHLNGEKMLSGEFTGVESYSVLSYKWQYYLKKLQ